MVLVLLTVALSGALLEGFLLYAVKEGGALVVNGLLFVVVVVVVRRLCALFHLLLLQWCLLPLFAVFVLTSASESRRLVS